MPQPEIDKLKFPTAGGQEGKPDDKAAAEIEAEAKAKADADALAAADAALKVDNDHQGTASKDGQEGDEFNAETSHQKLEKDFEQMKKNYDELRSKSTRDWQSSAERNRQFEAMQASMSQIVDKFNDLSTEKEDPEQFMENLKSQGPKYLDKYIDRRTESIKTAQETDKQDRDKETSILRYENAFMRLSRDKENFPGFEELESKMNALASDPNCPINLTQPIPVVLKALYKHVATSSTDENVRKAENVGAEKERLRLAKEANTAVVGSGRSKSSTPAVDFHKIPLDKLRQMLPKSDLRDYDD